MRAQRLIAASATVLMFAGLVVPAAAIRPQQTIVSRAVAQTVVAHGTISGKRNVRITRAGLATISSVNGRSVELRRIPPGISNSLTIGPGDSLDGDSAKTLVRSVDRPRFKSYMPGVVNVLFRAGISSYQDAARFTPSKKTVAAYTNDSQVNGVFAKLGVDRITRIASAVDRSRLAGMHARTLSRDSAAFNLANAFQVHLTSSTVPDAVRQINRLPSVAYAAPDWIVSTMNTGAVIPNRLLLQNLQRAGMGSSTLARFKFSASDGARASSLPANYGITTSLQSFLNAPGIDAVAAYDEIVKKYGQLPGQGEIITNVSLGDVCTDPQDTGLSHTGPTSHIIGGQHYLDVPSFPLIPEYVVDTDGNISGSAEVCGIDPDLDEILLDFSAMSPLPHSMQRAGETAIGPADILGIAPGAQYRLVVPGGAASVSALVAAFVAAGAQTPAPNVITASIGWGTDAFGFSSRYLEEDPLLRSTISTLVNAQNIVVCISAGDGLRKFTNAAVNPMGGSVPTNLAKSTAQVTDLNDLSSSTAPSAVLDTGAIDVGGSTTDDIYAGGNLADQSNPFANQLAFPEVRWNGAQGFSSGFGSRVNISAPSDNIPALILSSSIGNNYDSTALSLNGGTSASAPMVAAAAAVMLQVARLAGHPFQKATDVRDLLVSTAVPIPNVPQADMNINVGPQLNLRRAVETVLANAGTTVPPGAPRVSIAQRQLFEGLDFNCQFQADDDHDFVEATDPAYIRLDDREGCGLQENRNLNSPITIAPDWEGIPRGARYRLYVAGHPQNMLAQGPWARLWPKQIFSAAGLAAASSSVRTVTLSYDVYQGFHLVASTTFDLTFGPTPATSVSLPAPVVAPVITGATMNVSYDFSGAPPGDVSSPVIEVSSPSRPSPDSGPFYAALYKSPVLMSPKGTIQIPVSALGGAGVYGVAVNLSPNPDPLLAFFRVQNYSSFAFTRVQAANTSARPAAPLLAAANSTVSADPPSHNLMIAHGGSFTVSYDVRNVPGANNAALEISSSGPNLMNNENPFNNPNGSVPDDNGVDTGSVVVIPLPSTSGSITLTDQQAHLVEGMSQVVRVLPRAGTQGIGEAGDVSTISEPGITSPDGDDLSNGFAINTSGDDGVFTSQGGPFGSLIGVFSQSTGQVPGLIVQPAAQPFALIGGYVGNDTVVYQSGATAFQPAALNTFQVTSSNSTQGYFPSAQSLPPGWKIWEAGQNSSSPTSAVLAVQETNFNLAFGVFTANVGAMAPSTPLVALAPAFPFGLVPFDASIDYDPAANLAYVTVEGESPTGFDNSDDRLEVVNLNSSTVTHDYDLGDLGSIADLVIDPVTHVGAITSNPPFCGCPSVVFSPQLLLVNLNNGVISTPVQLPSATTSGGGGIGTGVVAKLAVDPVHHLFAVQNPTPAVDDADNNPLGEIDTFDENGNLVSHSARLYNLSQWTLGNHWFALNPGTSPGTQREGFMFGPNFDQIIPFSY